MAKPAYRSRQYQDARRQLLEGDPRCHWCGWRATEADHLVPVCEGGTHDLENLVPSCKPCNARRGSIEGHRRRALAANARPKPMIVYASSSTPW